MGDGRPRILLAYSLKDLAGTGVAEIVRELMGMDHLGENTYTSGDVILAGFPQDVLEFEVVERAFSPAETIVLSRHRSEARVKSLTVHHTGNPLPQALAGGRPRELGVANPPRAKQLLQLLAQKAEEVGLSGEFEVTLEVTHHGPTSIEAPMVFVEIGSSEEEWRDQRARRVMAEAVVEAVEGGLPRCRPAAGFGGGHYARKHTRLMLESDICYGHIYAKYVFKAGVDDDMLRAAFTRSIPQALLAIVEKKGVGSGDRARIVSIARSLGAEVRYI